MVGTAKPKPRLVVLVLAALATVALSASGTWAQEEPEPSGQEVVDYWTTQLQHARAALEDEIARVDEWAADDEIVLFRIGERMQAMRVDELRALLSAAFALVGPDSLSGSDPTEQAIHLVQRFGSVAGDEMIAALAAFAPDYYRDGVENLVAEVRRGKRLVAATYRERLDEEVSDLDEFAGHLDAFRAEVTAADIVDAAEAGDAALTSPDADADGGSAHAGDDRGTSANRDGRVAIREDDAVTPAADLGGPFDKVCLWRTGTHVSHAQLEHMRIYAWRTTAANGAGGPSFEYTAAWPEPGTDNPDRLLDRQEDDLAERLDDGTVVFKGSPGGFCAHVETLCPGARPNPCVELMGD